MIELHGYFRTRAQLFQNLFLGRHSSALQATDPEGQYLATIPVDQSYTQLSGQPHNSVVCGPAQQPNGMPTRHLLRQDRSLSANVRLRLDPEIDISDNLRIQTGDFSLSTTWCSAPTPNAYAMQPGLGATMPNSPERIRRATCRPGYNRFAPMEFPCPSTQGPRPPPASTRRRTRSTFSAYGPNTTRRSASSGSVECRANGVSAWSRTAATASTATTRRRSIASCSSPDSSRWTCTLAARGTSCRAARPTAAPSTCTADSRSTSATSATSTSGPRSSHTARTPRSSG